jgi:predicted LPLAT superfamily acyltransferase
MSNAGHWSALSESGSVAAMRAMAWIYRVLGRWPSRIALVPIVAYFYVRDPGGRAASRAYLEVVWKRDQGRGSLGAAPGAASPFRHYHEFARQLLDRMVLWGGGLGAFCMEHQGGEFLLDLARRKRGGILLGAHLGSFDMARQLATEYGLVLNVVMFTAHAERINRFFEQLDPKSCVRVLELDPASVKTAFAIKACLDRGELVGILADRVPAGGRERPVWLDFLGRPAPFPASPFHLIALLGCPAFVSLCVRVGDAHYRTTVEPLTLGLRLRRRDRQKGVDELMRTYVDHLEDACLRHPYQWFNFYDVWQTRSPA